MSNKATIIVAYDQQKGIGFENRIPWNIPEDQSVFKYRTIGQAVIMGRKTYDSLPKSVRPLPNRMNIVLSRNEHLSIPKVTVAHSSQQAIEIAIKSELKPFVIGGEEIYRLFLEHNLVDSIIATEIPEQHKVDTYFPDISRYGVWVKFFKSKFTSFDIYEYKTIEHVVDEYNDLNKYMLELQAKLTKSDILLARYKRKCNSK